MEKKRTNIREYKQNPIGFGKVEIKWRQRHKKEDVKFEDKQKALDAALSQIEKQFGKGAVMKLGGQ